MKIKPAPVAGLPPLSSADRDSLRESIKAHGVLVPILVTHTGRIIDGHERWRIIVERVASLLKSQARSSPDNPLESPKVDAIDKEQALRHSITKLREGLEVLEDVDLIHGQEYIDVAMKALGDFAKIIGQQMGRFDPVEPPATLKIVGDE